MQDAYQQVFEAVHKGNAMAVESFLSQHNLSANITNKVCNNLYNYSMV